jgi:signal recognition particle subunit SRP54
MFDGLSQRLQGIFRRLRGEGALSERTLQEGLREIRLALLEADVHVDVARRFLEGVRGRAAGAQVLASLNATQQLVGIVHEELTALLGGSAAPWRVPSGTPATILLVGLQGAGKTTTAHKLALWVRRAGRVPMLVAADWRRPAAAEQLQALARASGVPVWAPRGPLDAAAQVRGSREQARAVGCDLVLIDTAGRLHVDDELMAELEALKRAAKPAEVFLVADAMTGQDAVRSAEEFHRRVGLTGAILSKLDGDARGGAALSLRGSLGVPIRFVGTGEKAEALEPFHAERMASRILGMGDVLTLVERAQEAFEEKEAEEAARRLRRNEFTLEDFRDHLRKLRRLGSLEQLVGMLPGAGALLERAGTPAEEDLVAVQSILDSMTAEERRRPEILDGSRRRRIALGSGRKVPEVNRLLKQYLQMKRMLKTLSRRPGMSPARALAGWTKGRR